MSKFKIIEKSRFLNEEDLDRVKGGLTVEPGLCYPGKPFTLCTENNSVYASCTSVVQNFHSMQCGSGGSLNVCGEQMNYKMSFCSNLSPFTQSCSKNDVYWGCFTY